MSFEIHTARAIFNKHPAYSSLIDVACWNWNLKKNCESIFYLPHKKKLLIKFVNSSEKFRPLCRLAIARRCHMPYKGLIQHFIDLHII